MRMAIIAALLAIGQPAYQSVDVDLSDERCRGDAVIAELDGIRIRGTCSASGAIREVQITIDNTAPPEAGSLQSFGVGFCGTAVLQLVAPPGWAGSGVTPGGEAEWRVADGSPGLRAGETQSDFIVRLRPGWRRSRRADALWESSAKSTFTTHDCTEGNAA